MLSRRNFVASRMFFPDNGKDDGGGGDELPPPGYGDFAAKKRQHKSSGDSPPLTDKDESASPKKSSRNSPSTVVPMEQSAQQIEQTTLTNVRQSAIPHVVVRTQAPSPQRSKRIFSEPTVPTTWESGSLHLIQQQGLAASQSTLLGGGTDLPQINIPPRSLSVQLPEPPLETRMERKRRKFGGPALAIDVKLLTASAELSDSKQDLEERRQLENATLYLSREQLSSRSRDHDTLMREYDSIPLYQTNKAVACSGPKNRYDQMLPNTDTRVLLKEINDDINTSYINANFIKGYQGAPRAYIATQGPMTNTSKDFWRMIWEYRCPAIVMLTEIIENGKEKCHRYFPDGGGVETYGSVTVKMDEIETKNGYNVRKITLTNSNEPCTHTLHHFWYKDWPDQTTPDSTRTIILLRRHVRQVSQASVASQNEDPQPTVVHCSAGIGRTGCYIAIDIGSQQLEMEGGVDVLRAVSTMRLERGGVVQRDSQYIFIHKVLANYDLWMAKPHFPDSPIPTPGADSPRCEISSQSPHPAKPPALAGGGGFGFPGPNSQKSSFSFPDPGQSTGGSAFDFSSMTSADTIDKPQPPGGAFTFSDVPAGKKNPNGSS